MHINSALSTYFWDTKVRTFLLLDFQVFTACFLLRCPEYPVSYTHLTLPTTPSV